MSRGPDYVDLPASNSSFFLFDELRGCCSHRQGGLTGALVRCSAAVEPRTEQTNSACLLACSLACLPACLPASLPAQLLAETWQFHQGSTALGSAGVF